MSTSQKDEDLTENVLYRAIKLIPGLYDKPYNECLAAIKVSSMRYHRIQGDMILLLWESASVQFVYDQQMQGKRS